MAAPALADDVPLIDQPLAAADTVGEAQTVAEATNQPVMINDQTTGSNAVFALPDGTRVAELAGQTVRIPDPADPGSWVDVDMTLSDTGTTVQPRFSPTPIRLSDGGSDGFLAQLGVGSDQFTMSWLSSLPTPVLDGNRARYVDAIAGGVDLIVDALPSGVEVSYEIPHAPTGPLVLRMPLALRGLTATMTPDDLVELHDAQSGELVSEPAPAFMWGAATNPATDEPVEEAPVDLALTRDATGQQWLEARPDPAFFERPGVTYPVTIDPAFDLNGTADTFIRPDAPTTPYGSLTELQVGTPDGTTNTYRRTLMAFSLALGSGASLSGRQILNDTFLDIWQFLGPCSSTNPVELWGLNGSTPTSSTTWNTRPGLVGTYASASALIGCTSHPADYQRIQFGAGVVNGYGGQQVAKLVQGWASGSIANLGLALRAHDETTSTGWRKFTAADDTVHHWVMHVHYDTPPVVPTSVLPANGATVAGNVTLSGIYNDPDSGDGGKVYWIIKNAAGTVVRTVTGSHVGCDTTPSTCAPHASTGTPSPPLPAGNYTLQAKSNDGLIRWDGTPEESGLSPQTAFTVANTAPALPTITAPTDGDGLGRTISLRASYSDLNGDPGIVQFELVNANDDSVVATSSATIAPVVSGGSVTSTLTAPADDAYMVAARAFDGSTWSAWTDPENIIFAADNSWDATDGNLSVTPSIDSSVQDTNAVNPTLDATVKTNSLDRVAHAEFSLYARQPDGSNGVLVYTGIGDETVSGDISSIAVPTGVLSAGAAYNVHAALVQDDGVTVGGVDLSIVAGSTVVPEALDDSDGVYPTDPFEAGLMHTAEVTEAPVLGIDPSNRSGTDLNTAIANAKKVVPWLMYNGNHNGVVATVLWQVERQTPPSGFGFSSACLRVYYQRLDTKIKNGGRKDKTVGFSDVMARYTCPPRKPTEFIWEVKTANWRRSDSLATLRRYVRNRRIEVGSSADVYAGYKLNGGAPFYGPGFGKRFVTAMTIEPTPRGIPPTQGYGLVRYIDPELYNPDKLEISMADIKRHPMSKPHLLKAEVQADATHLNLTDPAWLLTGAQVAFAARNSLACGEAAGVCLAAQIAYLAATAPS